MGEWSGSIIREMPSTEADLLALTLRVHDAAANPSAWPLFLEGYAHAVGCEVVVIQRHVFSQHRSRLLATFGMTQGFTDSYNDHYSRLNVWREAGRHVYVAGRVFVDQEISPRSVLKRSEFFNDYLLP